MAKFHVKKDDTVKVISGESKGEEGKVLEVYPSNAAALAHMAAFAESPFQEEFLSLITVKSFQVVGNANAELKEVMAPYTTDFRKPLAGFSR